MALSSSHSSPARVAYVSDIELKVAGGGSYVVNWHAVDQLRQLFETHYVGPVVPRPPQLTSFNSRVRRKLLGLPGSFAYFSPQTLDANARRVSAALLGDEAAIVFRSAARWSRCKPRVPYFVYLDAVFHTFFQNTFRPEDFIKADLDRIFREEAAFLENASGVFFECEWGLARAREAYGLTGTHYHVVGRGGAVAPPATDTYEAGAPRLLTVAMDFELKGGHLVLEAFKLVKGRFPSLAWDIVGGSPGVKLPDGALYHGSLDPHHAEEGARFRTILSNASMLVHPSREDVGPLVVTEAAYFGCPAISVNAFAIPELVEDGESGLLLDAPITAQKLAQAIEALLGDLPRYQRMRCRARSDAIAKHSWTHVGNRLRGAVVDSINQHRGGNA